MKEIILEYLETANPEMFFEYTINPARDQSADIRKLFRFRSELIRMWKCKNKEKYCRSKVL
jgi:hypothetical protein